MALQIRSLLERLHQQSNQIESELLGLKSESSMLLQAAKHPLASIPGQRIPVVQQIMTRCERLGFELKCAGLGIQIFDQCSCSCASATFTSADHMQYVLTCSRVMLAKLFCWRALSAHAVAIAMSGYCHGSATRKVAAVMRIEQESIVFETLSRRHF